MSRRYRRQSNATRHSGLYLLSSGPENEFQKAVLELLVAEGILALVVDVGGKKLRGQAFRSLRAAGALVKGGPLAVLGGLTDIVGPLLWNGRALYLEIKAPAWWTPGCRKEWRTVRSAGAPSEEQLAFMDTMHAAGALVGVAWSVDDAIDLILGAR